MIKSGNSAVSKHFYSIFEKWQKLDTKYVKIEAVKILACQSIKINVFMMHRCKIIVMTFDEFKEKDVKTLNRATHNP